MCMYFAENLTAVSLFHSYFETFDVISDVGQSERLKLLDMMAKCSSKEELGNDEVINCLRYTFDVASVATSCLIGSGTSTR